MITARVFCATVMYPSGTGEAFDVERYATELAPRYAQALGENCFAFEVRRGLNSPRAPAPAFVCVANFWIRSREQFGAALGTPDMQELMADIAKFSNLQPLRQFDEQVMGEAVSVLSRAGRDR